MLRLSLNDMIMKHSDPAVMICKVNPLSSKNNNLMQFEILQFTKAFLEIMPKIAPKFEPRKRSLSIDSKSSSLSNSMMMGQELLALKQKSGIESRILDKRLIDQLKAKIFSPHLISNNTVFNFQTFADDGHLVCLIDIFRVFYEDNKQNARFYFKFDPGEYEEHVNAHTIQE